MLVSLVVNDVPITHNRQTNDAYGCFIAEDMWIWCASSPVVVFWWMRISGERRTATYHHPATTRGHGRRVTSTYAPLWTSMLVVLASSAVTLRQLTALLPSCPERNRRHLRRLRRKVRAPDERLCPPLMDLMCGFPTWGSP